MMACAAAMFAGAAPAWAGSMPGSSETLTLSASVPRAVGQPMTVTVEGNADGSHRLYVYGGDKRECDVDLAEEGIEEHSLLSQPGGESLPAGPFVRTYDVVPDSVAGYVVCAYLYEPPERFPDAWERACFVFPLNECYFSIVTPPELLSAEAEAQQAYAEAQQRRAREAQEATERRANEEAVMRAGEAAAAARRASEEAARRADDARRCRVPALRGHTLGAAKRLLGAANCRLGKVTMHARGRETLRVTAQSPRHGITVADGASVVITLGR
jgi:hypothetical protein